MTTKPIVPAIDQHDQRRQQDPEPPHEQPQLAARARALLERAVASVPVALAGNLHARSAPRSDRARSVATQ